MNDQSSPIYPAPPRSSRPPWWPWTRDFIRDFGWREYARVVIVDGNRYRITFWLKTVWCWLHLGHAWRDHFENVAPEVCFYSTGGWTECPRCGRCKDVWGHV